MTIIEMSMNRFITRFIFLVRLCVDEKPKIPPMSFN